MADFLISCRECGLLLDDMQQVQNHAKDYSHSNLSLSLDGNLKFNCCQCDGTFTYRAEMVKHFDDLGHKHYVNEDFDENKLKSYITPEKQSERLESVSVTRTVKKVPKPKEITVTPIPFILSDEEETDVFVENPSSLSDEATDGPEVTVPEKQSDYYGILFKVRSLNNIQLGVEDIAYLRKHYVIAEGVDSTIAKTKIQAALDNWEADNNTFKLVGTKRGDAFVYEERLKQICLTRASPRECNSGRSQRMYILLKILLEALNDDIVLRIRSLYYLYPTLHVPNLELKKQVESFNDTVADICLLLEVTRESLNLFASPRGLISGSLLLFSDGKLWVDCRLGGPSGCLIPSESVFINGIQETELIDFVLVLEKDTIFHYLRDHNFSETHKCVLVTGRGQADLSTRILLRKMRDFPAARITRDAAHVRALIAAVLVPTLLACWVQQAIAHAKSNPKIVDAFAHRPTALPNAH